MSEKKIDTIKNFLSNNILIIFIFFTILISILGYIYNFGLFPNTNKVNDIINKFKTEDYVLPYYVAERYLIWLNSRTFLFTLNYLLTLLGIIASLLTVFYASVASEKKENNKYIIFLSLLSTCFSIAAIFINPGGLASANQYAWRELDSCIMQTINNESLSTIQKNRVIIEKIVELEKYIGNYED